MFKIDSKQNEIHALEVQTFSELGFKERTHLQEWIAKKPSCLGEDLLIIQKEFSGFSDTQERLDLLALDKQGSLVIIENKLDDTGRDVTWQALKYAAYCSRLSKENVRKIYQDYLDKNGIAEKAETKLIDFFETNDYEEISLNKSVTQRIILIAANFRKEVTSTVLWLLNFNIRLQCFKATPHSMGGELFLTIDQIIPTKDLEEFMIGLAEKAQDEVTGAAEEKNRYVVRRHFWTEVIKEINNKSSLYKRINPGKYAWISAGSGLSGVGYNFAAGRAYGRAELYIDRGEHDENSYIFDELLKQRNLIEAHFGGELIWEPLEGKRACRIKSEIEGNIFEREQWPRMIEFMIDAMLRLESAFHDPLEKIKKKMKSK